MFVVERVSGPSIDEIKEKMANEKDPSEWDDEKVYIALVGVSQTLPSHS